MGESLSYFGSFFRRVLNPVDRLFDTFKKKSISIIICVYNGDSYLRECLESVKKQSLPNLEILCVDDGSTDNSSSIIQEFCFSDIRFKLIKNVCNQGPAVSRNKALALARGEYVQFLDADDYLVQNACEVLYNYSGGRNLDMLSFSGFNFDVNGVYENNYWNFTCLPDWWEKECFAFEDCKSFVAKMAVSSCLTIYKKSFIKKHDILFPEGLFFEDNFFFCKAIINAKKIAILKNKLYMRRVHDASITQNWDRHFLDFVRVATLILDFLIVTNIEENVIEQYKKSFVNCIFRHMKIFPKHVKKTYVAEVNNFFTMFNIPKQL